MSRSLSHLKLISQNAQSALKQPFSKQSLRRVLLAQGWVTESDLLKAWSVQTYEQAAIGEILIGMGKITEKQLYWALGELHGLQVVDFQTYPPSMNWTEFSSPMHALQMGSIIWRCKEGHITIAVTDPNRINALKDQYSEAYELIDFVLVTPSTLQTYIAETQGAALQENALACCPSHFSCKSWMIWSNPRFWCFGILTIGLSIAFLTPQAFIFTGLCIVFFSLVILIWFRLFYLYSLYVYPPKTEINNQKGLKRPKVSILVPLYKESAILHRLIHRLNAIDYPKELLEIHLIYEQNGLFSAFLSKKRYQSTSNLLICMVYDNFT